MGERERIRAAVPFTDPAQVDYVAYLQREIFRCKQRERELESKLDEVVDAVNAVMSFVGRMKVEEPGKVWPEVLVREFKPSALSKLEKGEPTENGS